MKLTITNFCAVLLLCIGVLSCGAALGQQGPMTEQEEQRTTRVPGKPSRSAFEDSKVDFLMVIGINVTDAFLDRMEDDDAAFKHVLSLIETFSRDTVGSEARLVITKLGGNDVDPLLWEGTPRQLRQSFTDPKDLRDFILKHRIVGAPHVLDGLVQTTKYMLNHEALDNRKCRPALFIVSDAYDSSPFSENFKQCAELAGNMTKLANLGGICGWYFVDQINLKWATKMVRRSGFEDFRVEAEIVRRPRVPRFHSR